MRATFGKILRVTMMIVILIGLVAAAAFLVRQKQATLAAAPRWGMDPVPVRTATTRQGTLEITRTYLAVVRPVLVAELSSRVTAVVESVAVREGDRVESGQVVVQLDDQEIRDGIGGVEAQIAQAEAEWAANEATVDALVHSVAYRRREADRLLKLRRADATSTSETDAAEDRAIETAGRLEAGRRKSQAIAQQIAALRHRLAELNTRLAYNVITSPHDGVVSLRHVDPGDMAIPGRSLLVIESTQDMKLAFDAPQQDLPQLRPGLELRYTVGGEPRHAVINKLFPALDQARMLRAEVMLSDDAADDLRSGEYVPIVVVLDQLEGVTLAPASALIESPGREPHVFVVENDTLTAVAVRVLGHRGDLVALAGIVPGRVLVTSTFLGWTRLGSGLAVEVLP